MDWRYINELLPKDKQQIIVYHEGLQKELQRTFNLEFWQKHKRIVDCDEFCRKWKARD
jgi:hypothetical protein